MKNIPQIPPNTNDICGLTPAAFWLCARYGVRPAIANLLASGAGLGPREAR